MEAGNPSDGKIIKSFCVVGLNESKLTKYNETEPSSFVQNIDMVQKTLNVPTEKIEMENEKWIKILKTTNCWLRIQYSKNYYEPITEIKIAECEYESPEYLLVPKKYTDSRFKPIRLTIIKDGDNSSYPILKENERILPYNDYYCKVPSYCNVKDQLNLPVKSQAAVFMISRNLSSLPLKDIKLQNIPGKSTYQFGVTKHKSPYIYTYMPELLDTYPQEGSQNPGVAVFCFPEGINIKTTLDMPKWFNFVLTDEIGRRTYGSTLIFTEDLSKSQVESFVPIYKNKQNLYVEKAICVLSNFPFYYNCKIFLRELYRIQVSSGTNIPLERAICQFVDSLYFQTFDRILSFTIAEEELKFYRVPIYGDEWDTVDDSIEILFSLLSLDNILTVWEGLLLEKKVFILSKSKSALHHVCMGLINLLFPFKWMHVLVPILPEKLKVFIDSPVPLLIGISFQIDLNELPGDALILNIDKNCFENYIDKLPKLPQKFLASMMKKLNKCKTKFGIDNPSDAQTILSVIDEVFPSVEIEKKGKFDSSEIRDIFYEFFVHMFKNYEKYFNWKKKKNSSNINEPLIFLKDVFLKDLSSTEPDSFLYTFSDTSIFTQFEDTFKFIEPNSPTSFFLDSIKKGRGKSKYYLPNKPPSISTVIPDIKIDDLGGKSFFYKTFPTLDSKLFIQTEITKTVYHSRFIYTRDEWCYDPVKLSNKDWGKYLMYTIYEIWFTFFAFVIHFYDENKSKELMEYAISLIDDLVNRKKISPSKNLFTKVIKSCGRKHLVSFVKPILNLVSTNNNNYNGIFHNAFMNGLYSLTENIGNNGMSMNNSSLLGGTRQLMMSDIFDTNINEVLETKLDKTIFLSYELCPFCLKYKKNPKKIIIEEILGGFSRSKSDYASICPSCLNKIFPKLYFLNESQMTLETESANFLSPLVLVKEVDSIIKNHGEKYFFQDDFYKDKYYRHIFWNIAFYFQLFDLPLCVMFIENNDEKFMKISNFLEESKARRAIQKKSSSAQRNMNKSADNQINILTADTMSKKFSSTSNDLQSVSGRSGVNNFSKYEKELWKGIQARIEKTTSQVMLKKASERNPNEDRGEMNGRLYDIKQKLSKVIDFFVHTMKSRLEMFLSKIEYNDTINGRNEEDFRGSLQSKSESRNEEKLQPMHTEQKNTQKFMESLGMGMAKPMGKGISNFEVRTPNRGEEFEDKPQDVSKEFKLDDIRLKEDDKSPTSISQKPSFLNGTKNFESPYSIGNKTKNAFLMPKQKNTLSYKVVINTNKK